MGAGVMAVCVSLAIKREKVFILGPGTNQLAEILAVKAGLGMIKPDLRARSTVTVYSDSKYAIGCLDGTFKKIRGNPEATAETKSLIEQFKEVRFEWVKGHAGHIGNVAADRLADRGSRPQ